MDTFSKYYEINYFYNSIYYNSFLDAIKEVNDLYIKNERQSNEDILLKTWYKNMDSEFDKKLRSDNFVNLLDNYLNSSLALFKDAYKEDIRSQLIYHDLFDSYIKYFYSPFISYSTELN